MKFKLGFFPRYAAACAFFVLASFSADSQNAPTPQPHGIVIANMDRAVKPGDDFFHYANGDWIKRTEIPPDRSYVGTCDTLEDLSRKRTAGLIEEAAKANAPAGSNARKIADLYNSYMDEAAIEAKGLGPLRPHLDAIAAIRDKHELARALGETLRADVDALNNTNFHTANLFGLWVAGGFNDSEHYAAYLMQGGLDMPDREYYLSDSQSMREIRTKYRSTFLLCSNLPDSPTRISAPSTSSNSNVRSPKNTSVWRMSKTSIRPTTPGSQPTSPPTLLASTGPNIFVPPVSATRPASSSGNPPPSPESPLSSHQPSSTHGKTGWPST